MIKRRRWQMAVAAALAAVFLTPPAQTLGGTYDEDQAYIIKVTERLEEQNTASINKSASLPEPVKDTKVKKTAKKTVPGASGKSGQAYGPALEAEQKKAAAAAPAVPEVQEYSLTETYHEDFEVYEENLENKYFIYTNVGNGGITDLPVYLDLPKGVACVMEKDGEPFPYESRQAVAEKGTYVAILSAVGESPDTAGKMAEYRAVFRFRIQERPVKKAEEESGVNYQAGTGYSAFFSAMNDEADKGKEEKQDKSGKYINEDGSYNEEAITSLVEGQIEGEAETGTETEMETETEQESAETYRESMGMFEELDRERGLFKYTLLSGEYFYANVPNGMTTNGGVSFETGEGLLLSVMKDGSDYENDGGNEFFAPGSYTVMVKGTGIEYLSDYDKRFAPQFHFRIADGPVNDMEFFNVPEELTLLAAVRGEETIRHEGSFVHMSEDGTYVFTLRDSAGSESEVTIQKDTQAPRFEVLVGKSRADINYLSEDIKRITVTKDGVTSESGAVYRLSGKGSYKIDVYDEAGNVSCRTFHLSYRFNAGAVVSVILLLSGALAVTFFIVKTKRKISVK